MEQSSISERNLLIYKSLSPVLRIMLSVLTLNTGLTQIRLFNKVLWEAVPDCDGRMQKIISSLKALQPDIVCLQEVYMPVYRKQLKKQLRTLYPNIIFFPSHGNMILSKYPVACWRNNLFNRMFWLNGCTLHGFCARNHCHTYW